MNKNERSIVISTDKDGYEAYITFHESSESLGAEDIYARIEQAGIIYGVSKQMIDDLSSSRKQDFKYTFARGKLPTHGKDGELRYLVCQRQKKPQPKIMDNGNADYYDIDFFENVCEGQALIETVSADEGKDGCDVFGRIIYHKPGKPAPKIPVGKNTRLNEPGTCLTAAISGRAEMNGKIVSVFSVLEIKGDVGPETGNINFAGEVHVHGKVMTGFSVNADGIVEIDGVVEGASITSKSDVIIKSGIPGLVKATISAGGNICAKFVEGASLNCKGDIITDSVMHSEIKCGGSLTLQGKNAMLVGGRANIGQSLTAKTIGSLMAIVTEIAVGSMPEISQTHKRLKTELETDKESLEKINSVIRNFSNSGNVITLPKEKKELLNKLLKSREALNKKIGELNKTIAAEFGSSFDKSQSMVSVTDCIRTGVKISIGNAVIHVKDEIYNSILKNIDGMIIIIPR